MFNLFDIINYNFKNGDQVTTRNLTQSYTIPDEFKTNPRYFVEYEIQDGETPEMIADRVYDDPLMSTILLMFNDIVDVYKEWPLSSEQLDQYVKDKYGTLNTKKVHHWVNEYGHTIAYKAKGYSEKSISNYQYEQDINDDKRPIKVMLPEYLEYIKTLLRQNNV